MSATKRGRISVHWSLELSMLFRYCTMLMAVNISVTDIPPKLEIPPKHEIASKLSQKFPTCVKKDTNSVAELTRAVIPNLVYAYPQGYEPGHLGVREKKLNNGGKKHIHQQLRFTFTTYKFEITVTVLITNIMLI